MIEVDEVGSSVELRREAARWPLLAAVLAVVALVALVVAPSGGGDEPLAVPPTPPTTPAPPTTSAPPATSIAPTLVAPSELPEMLQSLDLLLYGGDGPVRYDLATGTVAEHRGGDLLSGRELDVLGSFDGGIVLRNGLLLRWDLGLAAELGSMPHHGNLHLTGDRVWIGGADRLTSFDVTDGPVTEDVPGLIQVIGAHEGRPLAWRPFDGRIERIDDEPELVAEGSPLAGGASWLGLVECELAVGDRECDLRFVDLRTGIEWTIAGEYRGSSPSIVRGTSGRRAVLGFTERVAGDRVFLVDADELVTRPIDLASTHGAVFDPTDRYVLHPTWVDRRSVLCALDLESGRRHCVDPGVDFSGVLVRPAAAP